MTKVRAEWDGKYWVGIVEGGGLTQAKRLEQIAVHAVEVVKLMTGEIITAADVELEVVVPGTDIGRAAAEIAELAATVEAGQEQLAKRRRETARALKAKGFSLRDIGAITRLSHQRVDQLLADAN